ncbi:hypothetical protein [Streptomyces griseoloalbus]|uniref:Uncharacterized protein n=1 Tax=Streptomyces griseoloalbus TaxID=67303 RepID=A0A7W8BRX6_9ACTN|nr:hypothetical protein [Streptomyces albaduncus]MBB5128467.1 hypothetical protein [Streptomyces albaduncus]GGW68108.1 hypothetical protein GCM10010340_52790 [Streptomyces albaduncus]
MTVLARMRAALTRRAARRRADRALYRLAHRGDTVHTAATEDEQRDPDYCWTCGRKCGSQAHR